MQVARWVCSQPTGAALCGLPRASVGVVDGGAVAAAERLRTGGKRVAQKSFKINAMELFEPLGEDGGQSLFKSTYRFTSSYLQVPFQWTCWQTLGASSSIDIP